MEAHDAQDHHEENEGWPEEVADAVVAHAQAGANGALPAKFVCASGVSPSGPIHLGNLREVMTVHFVAEVLRARGFSVEHIHSWDDYDALRKVPPGFAQEMQDQLGRPLSAIPDPSNPSQSYADRFIREFEASLVRLGVRPRMIRQSRAYEDGYYRELIELAMNEREQIFDVLAEYQTKASAAATDKRVNYYPFQVYCQACGKNTTQITAYDAATASISYACRCAHSHTYSLRDRIGGKLVWKVDWPMRWRHHGVSFEPGGEDHSSPGSSFTVGSRLVEGVFATRPPLLIGYTFVGISGALKMSSSKGTAATPAAALEVLEPALLRSMYRQRHYRKRFMIDLGATVVRLYDEWDALAERVEAKTATAIERTLYHSARESSEGAVELTREPVSFRLLSSSSDVTLGDRAQMLYVVRQHGIEEPDDDKLFASLEPRLSCATRWATTCVPESARTHVRPAFERALYDTLDETNKQALRLLLDRLELDWSLAGLTTLVYGVPKLQRNLPLDTPPTQELKLAQRSFFTAIYRLICGSNRGPRIPVLLLALKPARVRQLLGDGAVT
jgi:lysyl-tRNA synthetase, class I